MSDHSSPPSRYVPKSFMRSSSMSWGFITRPFTIKHGCVITQPFTMHRESLIICLRSSFRFSFRSSFSSLLSSLVDLSAPILLSCSPRILLLFARLSLRAYISSPYIFTPYISCAQSFIIPKIAEVN